jgi:mannose-6-phosphate isomerase-like protein (cupin superfamily)
VKAAVVAAAVLAFALTASAQSARKAPSPAALVAVLAAVPAGSTGSATHAVVFPVGLMRAQLDSYIAEAKARGSAGTTLEDFGTYELLLSVRGRSSGAEVDPRWDEVMIVEQGSATLVTGGRVIDGHTDAQGETHGLRIVGGQRQEIGAGDILTVRAGTPYQILLSPGWVYSAFVIQVHEP